MRFDPRHSATEPDGGSTLRLRAPGVAALMVIVMTLLALLSVRLSGMTLSLQISLSLLTPGLAAFVLYRQFRHGPRRIRLFDERLSVDFGGGRSVRIESCRSVFLSPWYLGFAGLDQSGRQVARIGLFRDQFDRESYRQLSAWFRDRKQ
jgi:hypothetical protein